MRPTRIPPYCQRLAHPVLFHSLCFIAIVFFLVACVTEAQTAKSSTPKRARALPANSAAATELRTRLAALEAAKQSSESSRLTTAARAVAALSLRQIAELRLASGDISETVDILRRSLSLEEAPETQVDLATAFLVTGKLDEAMSQATTVVVADPQNALAWRVQGQIWLRKKNYQRATEALGRSAELHADQYTEYLLGCALLKSNQLGKAKVIFGHLFARKSTNPAALHAVLSDAYLNSNYLDDAGRELKQALALDPHVARAHYRSALLDSARKEWSVTPGMRAELAKEVELKAHDYFGNYALGLVQLFDGHYVQAEASLLRARNTRPEWPEPWLYLGLAAYNSGDQKTAEEDLRKAIALTIDDSRGNYQIRRAYYTLGRILTEQNRTADADEFVRHFRGIQSRLLLDAQTTPGAMGSGMAQMSQSASALAALAQLPTENSFVCLSADRAPTGIGSPFANPLPYPQPTDAKKRETELRKVVSEAFNDLGTVQAREEQFALALSHFHEAEKWNAETPGLMRNIGMAAARLSDYRESVRALRPVVASNPADTVARSMLALALFSTDSYREAAETFAPLGDEVLNRPELAYAWASSLVKINRFPDASAILHKLNERSVPPETLILIAQAWSQMGNYPQTVATCQKALSANSKLYKAHYIAGLALIHQDRPAEAAQEFRAELQLDPENAEAQFHLAFALLQLAQNHEATQWLRSVLAHNPEHPEANYELGKEFMSEGRSAEAIPYLEAAARLKPQFEPVHYQLQSAYRAAGRKEEADHEARVYRELKAKSRNITLPPPRQQSSETSSPDEP